MDLPLDETIEIPAELSPGSRVDFWVHIEEYDASRAFNSIQLKLELLRADEVLATESCLGYSFRSGRSGRGAAHHSLECRMRVPDEGADGVRVTSWLGEGKNKVEFDGVSLSLRTKE